MKIITRIIFLLIAISISFVTNASHVVYVVTGSSNMLKIIDTKTDKIIGEIGELENAHGLSGSANSQYLVAGSMSVKVAGKKSNMPAKPAGVSDEQHRAHHSDDTIESKSNTKKMVSIIHPESGRVIRRVEVDGVTHHTSVSPDGKIAVAVHGKGGGVSIIDLNKFNVIKFIKTGQIPNYAVFSADGKNIYVSNSGSGNVSVIDVEKLTVVKSLKTGLGPAHLALNAINNNLYVVNVVESTVSAIDLADDFNIKTYRVGKAPHGISVSTDGNWLFVSNKASNSLTRINTKNGDVKNITLTPAPYHVEVIPGTNKVYVSSRKKPKIWVIDQKKLKVLSEINTGAGVAHQMVIFEH